MNKFMVAAILIYLAFSTQVEECLKEINSNCTQEIKEVCGISSDINNQKRETFSNHCVVCGQGKVDFTVEGKCEKFPDNTYFCSPSEKNVEVCAKQSEPTCGWLDTNIRCNSSRCFVNYGNKCEACKNKKVIYTTKGECHLPDLV